MSRARHHGTITTKDGHVDKYRTSIPESGLGPVQNTQAWGTSTAYERYGKPRGQHETEAHGLGPQHPQEPEDRHAANYDNDTPKDWRVGFGKGNVESSEGKPGYVPNFRAPHGHESYRDGSVEDQRGQPPLRHASPQGRQRPPR